MKNFIRNTLILASLCATTSCSYLPDWLGTEKKLDMPGERHAVIHTSNDLNIDPKLENKAVDIPDAIKNSGWYKSSGIKSSLVQNLYLDTPLTKQAKFSVKGASDLLVGATPIIVGSKMYALDTEGFVHAFETQSARKLWVNDFFNSKLNKSWFSFADTEFINGGISYSDGVLFATAGLGKVVAIDASSGEVLWDVDLSSPTRTTPLKAKDVLIVQTTDNRTFALDPASGAVKWTHLGIGEDVSVLATSAPIAKGDALIIQYTSGEIYAIDLNSGGELWNSNVSSEVERFNVEEHLLNVVNAPTIDEQNVIAFGNDGILGSFHLKDGEVMWKKNLGVGKQIWVLGNFIYALTQNDQLIAVDKKTGGIKWKKNLVELDPTRKKVAKWTAPIGANNKIMVANSEGKLMSFDPTFGNKIDELDIDEKVYLAPVVADGSLFVMANDGDITRYAAK